VKLLPSQQLGSFTYYCGNMGGRMHTKIRVSTELKPVTFWSQVLCLTAERSQCPWGHMSCFFFSFLYNAILYFLLHLWSVFIGVSLIGVVLFWMQCCTPVCYGLVCVWHAVPFFPVHRQLCLGGVQWQWWIGVWTGVQVSVVRFNDSACLALCKHRSCTDHWQGLVVCTVTGIGSAAGVDVVKMVVKPASYHPSWSLYCIQMTWNTLFQSHKHN